MDGFIHNRFKNFKNCGGAIYWCAILNASERSVFVDRKNNRKFNVDLKTPIITDGLKYLGNRRVRLGSMPLKKIAGMSSGPKVRELSSLSRHNLICLADIMMKEELGLTIF